jgi:glycosyltransferase involved in cell wall biosynthesis
MKIAIVTNSAWAAFNFRVNLANALISEGNEVVFIIPFDNNYSSELKKQFNCHQLFIDPKSLNPLKELGTFFHLLKIYKRTKPEVICHFSIKLNIYGSIAAKVNNIPCLANITGLGTLFIKRNMATFFSEFLYRVSLFFSHKTFFQNNEDLNYFIDKNLISKSKAELLPGSGVDLKKFKYIPINKNSSKFVFLLVARLLKDKGIIEYIEAIRIIKKKYSNKQIEFQLLGDANSINKTSIKKSQLDDWVNQNLVNYLGTSDHVERFIAECNCVILPSYREGMPRTILESFAVGRPVIASDVAGCREIVEHNVNGLLCKVRSSDDLSEKMLLMMNFSEEKRIIFGKNGRKKVENFFNEEIVINKYLKVINNIA